MEKTGLLTADDTLIWLTRDYEISDNRARALIAQAILNDRATWADIRIIRHTRSPNITLFTIEQLS